MGFLRVVCHGEGEAWRPYGLAGKNQSNTGNLHYKSSNIKCSSHVFIGLFQHKSRVIDGSFVERELQLKASYASSPPCRRILPWKNAIYHHLQVCIRLVQSSSWVCATQERKKESACLCVCALCSCLYVCYIHSCQCVCKHIDKCARRLFLCGRQTTVYHCFRNIDKRHVIFCIIVPNIELFPNSNLNQISNLEKYM